VCPLLILAGVPVGNILSEIWLGAHIGNLSVPFYFAWALLWVAIFGVPSTAIRCSVLKERRKAQPDGSGDGRTRA